MSTVKAESTLHRQPVPYPSSCPQTLAVVRTRSTAAEHLASCLECREAVAVVDAVTAHVPTGELVAFALELPTRMDPEVIRRHLETCTSCRAEVELVREEGEGRNRLRFGAALLATAAALLMILSSPVRVADVAPSTQGEAHAERVVSTLATSAQIPEDSLFADGFENGIPSGWNVVNGERSPSEPSETSDHRTPEWAQTGRF